MKRLLYISTVWPETRSSAAGVRSFQMLKYLSNHVEVACASISKETKYKLEMSEISNTNAFSTPCRPNDSRFDQELREYKPDVVIFERFMLEEMFGWRVRKNLPETLRVVDTQDLHFLRAWREREVANMMMKETYFDAQKLREVTISGTEDEFMLREIASIVRSDATLLVSPFELNLLKEKFPLVSNSKLHVAPFFYNPPQPETFRSLERRKAWSAMTIGTFRHRPNLDSVHFLCDEISHKTERTKFRVYGAYPTKEHMNMSTDRVRIMGPAKDAQETISRHRILIAPLRFGAGIKGKITDAWRSGTPVVTTPIGAEGMGWNWELGNDATWGGLIANDAQGIANCVDRLMSDDDLWYRCQSKGVELLNENFDFESQGKLLMQFLNQRFESRKIRRDSDIPQSILWTEQFRSAEFKAKFIEKKTMRK